MAHVLGISGSLRRDSYNTRLLRSAAELLPEGSSLTLAEGTADIPFFNEDVLAAGPPASVVDFKAAVAAADAVLIATPEYNWGVPAFTKNLIDWLSRPMPANPLIRKPIALIGASTSPMGTIRAQLQLRQSLYPLGGLVIIPEVLVGNAAEKFDGNRLNDEVARGLLGQLLTNLVAAVKPAAPVA